MSTTRPSAAFDPAAPLNTRPGMPLGHRSFGAHYDPASTQRVIGRHVYVFRRLPGRLDVWRSELRDARGGYRWTLAHRFATAGKADR
ncbi:hypothetical protein [Streptomyces aidingensis]|uniref:Uncharacterized protein n=1 Tax=Streptomyces aidingensis TaxID=910347 RepID=A0A1I1Q0J9_9ACTN|nr:hypothetical protein [Streptomyces aidingensis]SFD13388.1 hypothetical protein SAMN05421773_11056 [Streptomyces aidingensis]